LNTDKAKSADKPCGLARFLTKYGAKYATLNRGSDYFAQLKILWHIMSIKLKNIIKQDKITLAFEEVKL
jgi:hypothetical protein